MQKKVSKISSEQLLHFVRRQTYLIDILNHNFYPRLCLEDAIEPLFKDVNVFVPMKCFCDIPIECINKHMKIYGEYGIGFKKSWGLKAGITPVLYYNEKSPYIQYMRKIYNERIDYLNTHHIEEENKEFSDVINIIIALKSSFTMYKPVYGKYTRANKYKYCFYDEREWRYIIPADSGLSSYFIVPKSPDPCLIDFIAMCNSGFAANNQIGFTYDDIDFVIIKNDKMKNKILEKLHVSPSDIEKLKPKIKTIDTLVKEIE